jgi:hypothetical protein
MRRCTALWSKVVFGVLAFAVLATAILTRIPKSLADFDQSFYLTIAYDLRHHGVFSNGIFDNANSVVEIPPPGMFFAPLYPLLIVGASEIDPRFARAVDCSVEANHGTRDRADCEDYARPMHILHALLLTAGALAIALAAENMFASGRAFWLAGALAIGGLIPNAELFSYIMTESVTFALSSATMLAMVLGWTMGRRCHFALAGLLLGLLCLTRFSFLALAAVLAGLILFNARIGQRSLRSVLSDVIVFGICFVTLIIPWGVRNYLSIGKIAFTEEYGAATLVERFAYDQMTAREFLLAFPYCVPEIGPGVVGRLFGPDAMARLQWEGPQTFFALGRAHRNELVATYKRLDPIIADLIRAEMQENGWWYLAVNVPLAWCGLWVGGMLALAYVPLFGWACRRAIYHSRPLFLLYATPAFCMLGVHVVLANHDLRYNLMLIGPYAAGAAWIVVEQASSLMARCRVQPVATSHDVPPRRRL